MSKISKNIKQLRRERGITQDELAEKLYVTRQAISSWENDRTQPDIQMLGRLREAFGVSIEELLYGEKRNTNLELEKPDYTKTLVTVFSILGGLLVAIGAVLMLAVLWDYVPEVLRRAASLIPVITGVAVILWIYKYKREKFAYVEGGAVASLIAIAVGVCLIYDVFGLYRLFSSTTLYFFLSAVAAAVMFILKAVSVLPAFYVWGMLWCVSNAEGKWFEYISRTEYLFYVLCSLGVLAVGAYFGRCLKKKDSKSRRGAAVMWITAVAFPIFVAIMISVGNYKEGSVISLLSVIALSYYIIDQKESLFVSPFRTLGFFGMAIITVASGVHAFVSTDFDLNGELLFICILQLVLLIIAAVAARKKKASGMQTGMCISYLAVHITMMVAMAIYEKNSQLDVPSLYMREELLQAADITEGILKIAGLVFLSFMIASGAREKKLMPINIGFAGFLSHIAFWIASADLSLLTSGAILLAFGAVLLFANYTITKKIKNEAKSK